MRCTGIGIFDKAKDLAEDHPEQVDKAVEKAGDMADEKTGAEHSDQIDRAQQKVREFLGQDGAEQSD